MRILIDIGHPAHVYLFKNIAHDMINHGHHVLFTCRDKEFEIELLRQNNFSYISFGKKYKSSIGKIWGIFKFGFKEWRTCLKFKPDILLSHGSMYASHAAFLIGRPHISFEDTFNFEQIRLYKPFTDTILTSDYDNPLSSDGKVIQYAGYHELAYLHPNRFTPDVSVLNELGVNEEDKYVLLRFVAWNASHDIGKKGIVAEFKIEAVRQLLNYAKVFISSERELPKELEKYRIKIAPSKMHSVMSFASIVLGESTTMAEEAAMLATPAVLIGNTHILYTQMLERQYGLIYNYTETSEGFNNGLAKCIDILKQNKINTKQDWCNKRNKMLEEKIDVTAFMVWFVENYPESKRIMKENPDYQYRFK